MLKLMQGKFNKIFKYFGKTNLKLIRSAGLIAFRDYIIKCKIIGLMNYYLIDYRLQQKIKYPITELLIGIILRILDGEERIYNFRNSVNNYFYEKIYTPGIVPHYNTYRYLLERNLILHKILSKILYRNTLIRIKDAIIKGELQTVTLDVDQMAREIYGKQEGAKKGYSPRGKGKYLYQVQVWAIRELRTLLKLELRPGNTHCINGFLKQLKGIVKVFKRLNIPITIIADAGYEDIDVMTFLESQGIKFIFSKRQRKTVKIRGKNAKKKTEILDEGLTFKERLYKEMRKKMEFRFREIFIQARRIFESNGQYLFEKMYSDEFTNVFITNIWDLNVEEIYEYYKAHAHIELIIEELRNDFGLGKSHNANFYYNSSMTQLIGLAYNIKTDFCKEVLNLSKIKKLSTLWAELIHIPGLLVNNRNKQILKLSENGFRILSPIFEKFDYLAA